MMNTPATAVAPPTSSLGRRERPPTDRVLAWLPGPGWVWVVLWVLLVAVRPAVQEWPFDDRTMTRIVAISTGVVTAVIARFVLRATGL